MQFTSFLDLIAHSRGTFRSAVLSAPAVRILSPPILNTTRLPQWRAAQVEGYADRFVASGLRIARRSPTARSRASATPRVLQHTLARSIALDASHVAPR